MSPGFPFDLPGATALYVALYVLTLVVHVGFMSYVLAGSGYVAVAAVRDRAGSRARRDPIAAVLRDWMPFALGGAITAGVAPLLFVQVLYKESFYTANLLLFHRWMAIIPVLMLGFYLLYLAKSKVVARATATVDESTVDESGRWSRRARTAISLAAFACFAVTAYSWTENHLLALDRSEWVTFYVDRPIVYARLAVVLRAATWIAGAFPLMTLVVAWQLRRRAGNTASDEPGTLARRLALVAMAGLLASVALGLAYALVSEQSHAIADLAGQATLHVAVLAVAVAAQLAAWIAIWRGRSLAGRALWLASGAAVVAVLATALLREALRMSSLDLAALHGLHARAAESGGMGMFALFLVINTAVIVWCIRLVALGKTTPT